MMIRSMAIVCVAAVLAVVGCSSSSSSSPGGGGGQEGGTGGDTGGGGGGAPGASCNQGTDCAGFDCCGGHVNLCVNNVCATQMESCCFCMDAC